LHAAFLSIVPRIELHGQVAFRGVLCPHRRANCISEMVALCWLWFLRLVQRGEERRHGFQVMALPHSATSYDRLGAVGGQRKHDVLKELLHDNGQTPVPDQVAFRLDFPAWRRTHARRTRRLMDGMILGERTGDLARKFGLSPGRISQLRRALHNDWRRFCGDPVA
jgi:hypothetical protein